jgi:hypothetical protein
MSDLEDAHRQGLVIESVDDSIVAAPRRPATVQFSLQRLAPAAWVGGEAAEDELDERIDDSGWHRLQAAQR